MSWRCPTCGRAWPAPQKWCGCEPAPDAPGAPTRWWLVVAGAAPVELEPGFAGDAVERFGLVAAARDVAPPYLLRRWSHRGVETVDEDGEARIALTPEALAVLGERA